MAKKNQKSTKQMASIALIVIGAGLAVWGHQKSGGFSSQLSSAINGSPSDNVMLLYIAAAVCVIAGVFLLVKK